MNAFIYPWRLRRRFIDNAHIDEMDIIIDHR